jgi:hypothetical protein
MFHRGEYLAKRVENLDRGGYPPLEMPAVENYGKGRQWYVGLRGIDLQGNPLGIKVEIGTVEREVFCSSDELQELWNGKQKLLVVTNLENLQARGGDPTKNGF